MLNLPGSASTLSSTENTLPWYSPALNRMVKPRRRPDTLGSTPVLSRVDGEGAGIPTLSCTFCFFFGVFA